MRVSSAAIKKFVNFWHDAVVRHIANKSATSRCNGIWETT